MSDRPLVIQAEHLAAEAAAWLAERCRLAVLPRDDPRFEAAIRDAEGLLVRTYTDVDGPLLAAAPRLRVVGRAGAGLDNIDVPACRSRDVEVVYTPEANTQAVVEYVVGLLARALREPPLLDGPVDPARWRALRGRHPDRPQMSGMTLGVLGLGRIGRRLAEVGRALGFERVLYHDLVEIPPPHRHGALPVGPQELFTASDVLTIHVDGRASNRHYVGPDLLRRLKPAVVLVNTSRGFVVDAAALAGVLRERPHSVALLDVHEQEPFDAAYPLLGLPNARLYPHAAASTREADLAMSWVVRDVVAVLQGRAPRHPAPDLT